VDDELEEEPPAARAQRGSSAAATDELELTPGSSVCTSRDESEDSSESSDGEETAGAGQEGPSLEKRPRQVVKALPPGAAPLFTFGDDPIEALLNNAKTDKVPCETVAPPAPLSDGTPLPVPTVQFQRVSLNQKAKGTQQKPNPTNESKPPKPDDSAPGWGAYAHVNPQHADNHGTLSSSSASHSASEASSVTPDAVEGKAALGKHPLFPESTRKLLLI